MLISCSPKKLSDLKHNQSITLTGNIVIIGNFPFTHYALTVNKHHYTIILTTESPEISNIIQNNVGKNMITTGIITIKEIKSANQKYSMKDYQLNVTKIKPNQ